MMMMFDSILELHAQEYRAIEKEKDYRPKLLVDVRKVRVYDDVCYYIGEFSLFSFFTSVCPNPIES